MSSGDQGQRAQPEEQHIKRQAHQVRTDIRATVALHAGHHSVADAFFQTHPPIIAVRLDVGRDRPEQDEPSPASKLTMSPLIMFRPVPRAHQMRGETARALPVPWRENRRRCRAQGPQNKLSARAPALSADDFPTRESRQRHEENQQRVRRRDAALLHGLETKRVEQSRADADLRAAEPHAPRHEKQRRPGRGDE